MEGVGLEGGSEGNRPALRKRAREPFSAIRAAWAEGVCEFHMMETATKLVSIVRHHIFG